MKFNWSFLINSALTITLLSSATVSVHAEYEPPKPTIDSEEIRCIANCQPQYPSALDGAEGTIGIRMTINSDGQVTDTELVQANSNMLLNRQALLAVRRMKFSKIDNEAGASVVVKINFTVKGSELDRLAREGVEVSSEKKLLSRN